MQRRIALPRRLARNRKARITFHGRLRSKSLVRQERLRVVSRNVTLVSRAISSVLDRVLPTREVAGSNHASRTSFSTLENSGIAQRGLFAIAGDVQFQVFAQSCVSLHAG